MAGKSEVVSFQGINEQLVVCAVFFIVYLVSCSNKILYANVFKEQKFADMFIFILICFFSYTLLLSRSLMNNFIHNNYRKTKYVQLFTTTRATCILH